MWKTLKIEILESQKELQCLTLLPRTPRLSTVLDDNGVSFWVFHELKKWRGYLVEYLAISGDGAEGTSEFNRIIKGTTTCVKWRILQFLILRL